MESMLFYGLYKLTDDPGYPLAVILLTALIIINIIYFPFSTSLSLCNIVVIIFDIILVIFIIYIFHKKRKNN